jgi:hypothetical protein
MSDKFILILVVILLVSGLYTYDQYQVNQGEPSPIGQFIDYAGLAKYMDIFEKQDTIEVETQVYQFDSKGKLERLIELQAQIREKRNELVAKRQDILKRIFALNHELKKETEVYIDLLDKEKDRILASLPKIQEYAGEITNAAFRQDGLTQKRYFDAFKREIFNVFEGVTDDPRANVSYLFDKVDRVEKLMAGDEAALMDFCTDIRGTELTKSEVTSRCIKKRMREIQEDIHQYSKVVKAPADDFAKMRETMDLLEYELELLENNSEATENKLTQGADKVEEGLRYLVQELVEITDEEMHSFLRLYSQFQKEQEALLRNLANNHKRLISSQRRYHPRIKSLLNNLQQTSQFDFSDLLKKYEKLSAERESLMGDFIANERRLFVSTKNRRKYTREYVTNLVKRHESLKKKVNPQDSQITHSAWGDDGEEEEQAGSGLSLFEKRRQQRKEFGYEQEQTKRDMERLRQKARYDGFYD